MFNNIVNIVWDLEDSAFIKVAAVFLIVKPLAIIPRTS
jgi:hypothetical protein